MNFVQFIEPRNVHHIKYVLDSWSLNRWLHHHYLEAYNRTKGCDTGLASNVSKVRGYQINKGHTNRIDEH